MLMTEENTLSMAQNSENLVVFRLNRIYYAIAIEAIQQIIEMVVITPVLDTEAWMEGVINYHGSSIPVVNLRRHFRMEVVPYSWHTPIILVNILDRPVGLIVDDVLDVTTIAPEQIVAPCSIIPQGLPRISLLKGIIQTGDKLILMLDLAHLFDQVQVGVLSATAEAMGEQPEKILIEKVKKASSKKRNTTSKEKVTKKKKTEEVETTGAAAAGMEQM